MNSWPQPPDALVRQVSITFAPVLTPVDADYQSLLRIIIATGENCMTALTLPAGLGYWI
jgi:hypothetical protein